MKPKTDDIDAELKTMLKRNKSIVKRIFDVLELELKISGVNRNMMPIYSKKSKMCLFSDLFLDVAEAALFILEWPSFHIDFSKHVVNNPLYGCKCIEEILVKLDLLEDIKNCTKAGASDET